MLHYISFQEVATHELKKGQVSHSRANEGYGDYETELFHQPVSSKIYFTYCVYNLSVLQIIINNKK